MSYARFGWNDSDVYVFLHVGGWFECSMCSLSHEEWESFRARDTKTIIDHLKKHQKSGYNVPQDVFELLWEDHKENMKFIREVNDDG